MPMPRRRPWQFDVRVKVHSDRKKALVVMVQMQKFIEERFGDGLDLGHLSGGAPALSVHTTKLKAASR